MSSRRELIAHLRAVPLFAGCSAGDLARIAKLAEDVDVDVNKVLIREGATGHQFFVILRGQAVATRKGRRVATLGPGQHFGELSLLAHGPRTATVTAMTPMEVVVFGHREFTGLIDEVPGLARKLLRGLAARLRDAEGTRGVH